jgi:hypothetical protein
MQSLFFVVLFYCILFLLVDLDRSIFVLVVKTMIMMLLMKLVLVVLFSGSHAAIWSSSMHNNMMPSDSSGSLGHKISVSVLSLDDDKWNTTTSASNVSLRNTHKNKYRFKLQRSFFDTEMSSLFTDANGTRGALANTTRGTLANTTVSRRKAFRRNGGNPYVSINVTREENNGKANHSVKDAGDSVVFVNSDLIPPFANLTELEIAFNLFLNSQVSPSPQEECHSIYCVIVSTIVESMHGVNDFFGKNHTRHPHSHNHNSHNHNSHNTDSHE